eukprot:21836-Amphidinium_carterae.1
MESSTCFVCQRNQCASRCVRMHPKDSNIAFKRIPCGFPGGCSAHRRHTTFKSEARTQEPIQHQVREGRQKVKRETLIQAVHQDPCVPRVLLEGPSLSTVLKTISAVETAIGCTLDDRLNSWPHHAS